MTSTTIPPGSRVTRDDLEAKFRELQGDVQAQAASAKGTIIAIGGVLAIILALVVFMLGRRAGKQRTTVVEIRRV